MIFPSVARLLVVAGYRCSSAPPAARPHSAAMTSPPGYSQIQIDTDLSHFPPLSTLWLTDGDHLSDLLTLTLLLLYLHICFWRAGDYQYFTKLINFIYQRHVGIETGVDNTQY